MSEPRATTWQGRIKAHLGPRGYQGSMRRSIQTLVLYEAKRTIEPRLKTLRAHQRKEAFMEQCFQLLETLDFIPTHLRDDVLLRTMTSRVNLDGETAWARLKGVHRELDSMAIKIKPFLGPGRTHNEAVDLMVQDLFETKDPENKGKTCPSTWEYSHNHVIMAFRLYYKGDKLDPLFPMAAFVGSATATINNIGSSVSTNHMHYASSRERLSSRRHEMSVVTYDKPLTSVVAPSNDDVVDDQVLDVEAILAETNSKQPNEERRLMLKEVREHLDLLKEFEGVISEEELLRRKRELFLALPPAPPPKKIRSSLV